jgi:hypothetical protein
VTQEEIIKVMNDSEDVKMVGYGPEKSVGEGVEDEWGGTETKWKTGIEIVCLVPRETQKGPFGRPNGAKAEGVLDVQFCHEWCWAVGIKQK